MKEKNTKKIVLNIVKIIAFVLAFFLILECLSTYVFSAKKTAQISRQLADSYTFIDEPEDTIQIIALGSSDMWSGFVPIDLWDNYGYTSDVACNSHQTVNQAKKLLSIALETQSPSIVLFEVDTLYDSVDVDDVNEDGEVSIESLLKNVEPDEFETDVELIFPTFTFHNYWKNYNRKSARKEYSHGYLFNDTVVKNKVTDYMAETDEVDMPPATAVSDVKAFAEYCRSNNAQLIFVEMPSPYSWSYARYNGVKSIADEVGVDFIDLNLCYDEIGISMKDCFRDQGSHLNYAAASKATVYIGSYLKEHYNLTDNRSNPTIADEWNSDSENFKIKNKINQ